MRPISTHECTFISAGQDTKLEDIANAGFKYSNVHYAPAGSPSRKTLWFSNVIEYSWGV